MLLWYERLQNEHSQSAGASSVVEDSHTPQIVLKFPKIEKSARGCNAKSAPRASGGSGAVASGGDGTDARSTTNLHAQLARRRVKCSSRSRSVLASLSGGAVDVAVRQHPAHVIESSSILRRAELRSSAGPRAREDI